MSRAREAQNAQEQDARADAVTTPRRIVRTSRPGDETLRDLTLLDRLRAGDDTALAVFVQAYAERLRDFAYLTVRDSDLAADIVQDVFVWLWEHRLTLAVSGTVADYLYRATRNRALNVVKHERVQDRVRIRFGAQYVIDPAAAMAEMADGRLVANELRAAMERAVAGLTPRVREVFLLAQVEHMTYDEIAAVLSVSVSTVQSQLSRAIKQIRTELAEL
jgi:RNA polymerase sigma-70 factor (ECF subfamily)